LKAEQFENIYQDKIRELYSGPKNDPMLKKLREHNITQYDLSINEKKKDKATYLLRKVIFNKPKTEDDFLTIVLVLSKNMFQW